MAILDGFEDNENALVGLLVHGDKVLVTTLPDIRWQ